MKRPGDDLGVRIPVRQLGSEPLRKLKENQSCPWMLADQRFGDSAGTRPDLHYCIESGDIFGHRIRQITGGWRDSTDSCGIVQPVFQER